MSGFLVTYGPVPRLWCEVCDKAMSLSSLDPKAIAAAEAQHLCGERTSPWASAGVR